MEATNLNSEMGKYAARFASMEANKDAINHYRALLKSPNLPLNKQQEYSDAMDALADINLGISISITDQVLASISDQDMFNIGYACDLIRHALENDEELANALSQLPALIQAIATVNIPGLVEPMSNLVKILSNRDSAKKVNG